MPRQFHAYLIFGCPLDEVLRRRVVSATRYDELTGAPRQVNLERWGLGVQGTPGFQDFADEDTARAFIERRFGEDSLLGLSCVPAYPGYPWWVGRKTSAVSEETPVADVCLKRLTGDLLQDIYQQLKAWGASPVLIGEHLVLSEI